MTISQRQFDQLTEMGISLWMLKGDDLNINQKDKLYLKQNKLALSELSKKLIFNDVIRAIGISIGEITPEISHLDLGLFNWYFVTPENNEQSINCHNNNLFSPSLAIISQSPKLKKQLWQTILNNLI